MRALSLFTPQRLALDVGTAMTRVCSESSPILESPSMLRANVSGGEGGSPILRGGVVCDIAAAAEFIEPMIRKLSKGWQRPTTLICTPTDATRSEREALVEAVTIAGAAVALVVPEPLAAAIGSGMDVASEYAGFVVDIGEGVTDAAIIREGAVVHTAALRSGCSDVRRALFDWFAWQHGLAIDHATANALVIGFCGTDSVRKFSVGGRSADTRDATVSIGREELAGVIEPAIETIATFVARVFRNLADSIAVEVIESGLTVTGGGAALDLLVRRIERMTGLTVSRPDDPYRAVIRGARAMLHNGVASDQAFV